MKATVVKLIEEKALKKIVKSNGYEITPMAIAALEKQLRTMLTQAGRRAGLNKRTTIEGFDIL